MARLLPPDRPDWRWARVADLTQYSSTAAFARLEHEDEQTRRAFEFRRALDRSMGDHYPEHEAAYTLFMDRPDMRLLIEGLLIGGAEDDQIGHMSFCDSQTIRTFHDLFFDVRPGLDRPIWLTSILFGGLPHANSHHHDVRGTVHRLAYKLGHETFLEMVDRGLSSDTTVVRLKQMTTEILMGQMAGLSFSAGTGREIPEWMGSFLNQKDTTTSTGSDFEKAIDTFFEDLAITVADPTDDRNLNLPAREARVADYEVVPNER